MKQVGQDMNEGAQFEELSEEDLGNVQGGIAPLVVAGAWIAGRFVLSQFLKKRFITGVAGAGSWASGRRGR